MGKNYQVMPELTAEEYAELKADIAERGVMVPIEFDEEGNILDGYNRKKICDELGITDYPKVIRAGMTEEEKLTHARKLNMARRHLSQEQKRDLIRDQIKATPEKSDRQIASDLGVSPTTIGTARRVMEESGDVSKLDTSIDTLGRVQPRQRKPVSAFNPSSREAEALKDPDIQRRLSENDKINVAGAIREQTRENLIEHLESVETKEAKALVGVYRTWSAWDAQGREWKFQRDVSILGPEEEETELGTPILHYDDIETLQELIRQLRHAGAKSDASRGCGVHIHIGAQGHTPQTIRNLANIMASHENLLADALNLDGCRMTHYCRTVDPRFLKRLNKEKPQTFGDLADIWYESQNADYGRNEHYNDSRYHMLNLHATFTKGTIEFRLFQFDEPSAERKGGLHAGQLKSYIQLCLALSEMAKEVKTASPKPQQTENPKYAMRTWLLRLGFIGDEFKTARDILTRNLNGDLAFRDGRRAA